MTNLRIISVSPKKLVAKGQECLAELLISSGHTPILFLSSGGSSLKLLEQPPSSEASNLTITVLDERFSHDETINNCAQLLKTPFAQTAIVHGAQLINTQPRDDDTPELVATRFENALRDWKTTHPTGKIIATLGMGADGHTAGIFPEPKNPNKFARYFLNPNRWVIHYNAGRQTPFPERITTTIPFIRSIDEVLVFVQGEDKATTLATVLDEKTPLEVAPAGIMRTLKSVTLLTDALL